MTDPTASGPKPAPTPVPAPTRRIVTVRRVGLLRWGAAGIAVGILLVGLGWLITAGSQAIQVAAAQGRAQVGNPVTFDAGDGTTYAITVIPEPTTSDFVEDRISQLGCTVDHPSGEPEVLDVSSSSVRTTTSVGIFAADFEGRGGETTVRCEWEGPSGLGSFYAVGKTHKATRYLGTGTLVGGIVIGLVGVSLLVTGYKGKPELQDIEPPPATSGP